MLRLMALTLVAGLAAAALPRDTARAGEMTAHDFAFQSIDGGVLRLLEYRGGPVLVINTASRCGFTHQYEGMQTLYDRYRDQGLTVLAVPSNDFRQELGSEAEIKEFCELHYGINFPMTGITPVIGTGAHPFYAWAREALGQGQAPRWNFHKYLIGPDGRLVAAFGTGTPPTSPKVTGAIERLLPEG